MVARPIGLISAHGEGAAMERGTGKKVATGENPKVSARLNQRGGGRQ